jgi:DNA-directed RNA polymerase specialized sigma subunit
MSILHKQDKKHEMNQQEVADVLGVSRAAIQQTEVRAIRKILKLLEDKKIKKEDFF